MPTDRRTMTVRIVPLDSPEAGDARMGGTAEERLAVTFRLSETGWKLTGRPLPEYTRGTMPVRIIRRTLGGSTQRVE